MGALVQRRGNAGKVVTEELLVKRAVTMKSHDI